MILACAFALACLAVARRLYGRAWLAHFPVWFLILFLVMDFIGIHDLWLNDVGLAVHGEQVAAPLLLLLYAIPLALLAAVALTGAPAPAAGVPARGIPAPCGPAEERALLVLALLGCVLLGIYLTQVQAVPLLQALVLDDEVSSLREASTQWQEGSSFRYLWLLGVRYMLPLLAAVQYAQAALHPTPSRRWRARLLGALSVFVLVMEAQKAQVIFFGVQMAVARSLVQRHRGGPRPLRLRRLAGYGLALAAALELLALMYYLFLWSGEARQQGFLASQGPIFEAMLRRLTVSQAEPVAILFKVFPQEWPFLHGASLPWHPWLHHGLRFDLSGFSAAYRFAYTGTFVEAAASSLYVGEFYANYGLPGAAAALLAGSALLAGADRWLFPRTARSVPMIGIYAFLTMHIMRLAITQVFMGLMLPVATVLTLAAALAAARSLGRRHAA